MSSGEIGKSKNPIDFLPFDLSYIPDNFRRKAKTELFEDENIRIQSLKLFRSMLKDENHLHWQDEDLFLLSFLRARKFDVKRAFQLIKSLYTVMGKHPELYSNFNFADVRRVLDENGLGFLPYRDREGCAVFMVRNPAWHPEINSLGDVMRSVTCSLFYANLSPATQIAGVKLIFDLASFGLRHLPYVSPSYLWLFVEGLQNCFPARFRGIHFINDPPIFNSVFLMLKPLLSKKAKERFHFHGKNIKKLQKHFSRSILPSDYGGELPPFNNSEWAKKMEDKAEYFSYVFSHGWLSEMQREDMSEKSKPQNL